MAASGRPKIDVYPVASFIVMPTEDDPAKSTKPKDHTALAKLTRLKRRYEDEGSQCVHSVEAVMLVHAHNHPHVLLLRRTAKPSSQPTSVLPITSVTQPNHITFRLPGGKVRGTENASDCLYRKLARDLLGQSSKTQVSATGGDGGTALHEANDENPFLSLGVEGGAIAAAGSSAALATAAAQQSGFRVGEVLSVWCRPNFDRLMYPYTPAHVSDPKELRTIFLVHMPAECMLSIHDANTDLVAVPLFELYENAAKYGSLIASIPHMVSRFYMNLC